jgi:hypothetical protein
MDRAIAQVCGFDDRRQPGAIAMIGRSVQPERVALSGQDREVLQVQPAVQAGGFDNASQRTAAVGVNGGCGH